MSMIKTENLIFEYEKRDDEGNIIGAHRAIDEVNFEIEPGQFIWRMMSIFNHAH